MTKRILTSPASLTVRERNSHCSEDQRGFFARRIRIMKSTITMIYGLSCALVVASGVGLPSSAEAQITRIEITRVESPTFEGMAFGDVGPYEKIVGRAFGEVDPQDPRNAAITDIALAPRNVRGR